MANVRALQIVIGLLCSSHRATGFVAAGMSPVRGAAATTELRGGYDQTVGADPSTPIQFFVLPGNTCPYAQRTHIALVELGIPFDTTEVSGMPKPDWYLKINPRGKVRPLKNKSVNARHLQYPIFT